MAWTDLKERDVAKQVSDFLEFRGWRRLRNQVGLATNMGGHTIRFGEKGMADLLFLLYLPQQSPTGECIPHAMVMWLETKRKGGKLSLDQTVWQAAERARGALVLNVDHFEIFAAWYDVQLGWLHSASGTAPGNLDLFAADTSPPE